jgi:hypothetical protein
MPGVSQRSCGCSVWPSAPSGHAVPHLDAASAIHGRILGVPDGTADARGKWAQDTHAVVRREVWRGAALAGVVQNSRESLRARLWEDS